MILNQIQKLKNQYVNATTEKERESINKKISLLSHQNPEDFAAAMLESAKDTRQKAETLALHVGKRK